MIELELICSTTAGTVNYILISNNIHQYLIFAYIITINIQIHQLASTTLKVFSPL
jgi:hypothetical protein